MTARYQIAPDGSWIHCFLCGSTSHNRNDVKMRYCAACHSWLDVCCDFCSGHGETAHVYHAASQIRGTLNDSRSLVDGDGQWAACSPCSVLIEAGDWERMIERVMASHDWTEDMRPKIIFMYQAVFGDRFTVTK